ncbi:hypothetical protein L2E82_36934 [Cichorium intybus]|uniref:Uncharacterized protein n=1 Tax=Cichorium intybus TaxID=13427 RepID=A0ACB9AEN5_CICIN|nr:hypothetical protein L2E82_36934 [Cichorium intybus]
MFVIIVRNQDQYISHDNMKICIWANMKLGVIAETVNAITTRHALVAARPTVSFVISQINALPLAAGACKLALVLACSTVVLVFAQVHTLVVAASGKTTRPHGKSLHKQGFAWVGLMIINIRGDCEGDGYGDGNDHHEKYFDRVRHCSEGE